MSHVAHAECGVYSSQMQACGMFQQVGHIHLLGRCHCSSVVLCSLAPCMCFFPGSWGQGPSLLPSLLLGSRHRVPLPFPRSSYQWTRSGTRFRGCLFRLFPAASAGSKSLGTGWGQGSYRQVIAKASSCWPCHFAQNTAQATFFLFLHPGDTMRERVGPSGLSHCPPPCICLVEP